MELGLFWFHFRRIYFAKLKMFLAKAIGPLYWPFTGPKIFGLAQIFLPDHILNLHIVLVPNFCARPKDGFHLVNSVFVVALNTNSILVNSSKSTYYEQRHFDLIAYFVTLSCFKQVWIVSYWFFPVKIGLCSLEDKVIFKMLFCTKSLTSSLRVKWVSSMQFGHTA